MQQESTGIAKVTKRQQLGYFEGGTLGVSANQTVFIPSFYEVWGNTTASFNPAETRDAGCFQYAFFAKGGQTNKNIVAVKPSSIGAGCWWTRSAMAGDGSIFWDVYSTGDTNTGSAGNKYGVVPCFTL